MENVEDGLNTVACDDGYRGMVLVYYVYALASLCKKKQRNKQTNKNKNKTKQNKIVSVTLVMDGG